MLLNKRQEKKKKARFEFMLFTTILYLLIVGVALGVDNLLAVFNIIGAVSSTSIGILMPCFFYFRLVQIKGSARSWKYYSSIVTLLVMVPYAIFSMVALYV